MGKFRSRAPVRCKTPQIQACGTGSCPQPTSDEKKVQAGVKSNCPAMPETNLTGTANRWGDAQICKAAHLPDSFYRQREALTHSA